MGPETGPWVGEMFGASLGEYIGDWEGELVTGAMVGSGSAVRHRAPGQE